MSDARERAEKAYPVFMPDGQKAPIRELDRESKALRRGYERGWNECERAAQAIRKAFEPFKASEG